MLLLIVATGAVAGTVALAAELPAPGTLRDVTSLTGAAGIEGAGAVALLVIGTGEGDVVLGAVVVALLELDAEAADAAAAAALPASVMFAAGADAGSDAGTRPAGTALAPGAKPVQGIPVSYRVYEGIKVSQSTQRADPILGESTSPYLDPHTWLLKGDTA